MSMTGVNAFDTTIQKTNRWIHEVCDEMGWDNRERGYRTLRAVLHALRDRLIPTEAVELGAQLPMLVRGFYYESWRPTETPSRERQREEFLARIREELRPDDADPEETARAVFKLIAHRISEGEMQDVRHMLPEKIRELFPEVAAGADAL